MKRHNFKSAPKYHKDDYPVSVISGTPHKQRDHKFEIFYVGSPFNYDQEYYIGDI